MKLSCSFIAVTAKRAKLPGKFFAGVFLVPCFFLISFLFCPQQKKPVLYITGDSTVRNGNGTGSDGLWGWGSFISSRFDTTVISVENQAIGGRSSRTFITEGRWDRIVQVLKPGDFVIIQFGHNDAGPLDDTARARGTIKGIGNEYREIYNPVRKQPETVYTYGWYMRRYVNDVKNKGAVAIICSPVPRNNWPNDRVIRSDSSYGLWAKQVADETGAFFIDLNNEIAGRYELLGQEKVNGFFPKDHTHPNKDGSELNAAIVIDGIKKLEHCNLKRYLNK